PRVGMPAAGAVVAVFEERLRQAVTSVPSFPELAARLTRAVTVAIDRTKTADANGHGLPLVSRLRIATFFALACGVIFLPVDGSGVVARDTSFWLLVLYAWHAVLTSFVLIASFTARGERNADRLAVLLVVGHAVNLHAYVYVWPVYPGLAAGILACMLMGDSVLFGWSTQRVLTLAIGFSAGFLVLRDEDRAVRRPAPGLRGRIDRAPGRRHDRRRLHAPPGDPAHQPRRAAARAERALDPSHVGAGRGAPAPVARAARRVRPVADRRQCQPRADRAPGHRGRPGPPTP